MPKRLFKLLQHPQKLLPIIVSGSRKQLGLSLAKEMAKILLGQAHAAKIDQGTHPDLHLFLPIGKMGLHSIDAMKQLMHETAFPPYEAAVKVFVIFEAERMLAPSSNSLLKTLEELPSGCYLFLLTNRKDQLLPTINSRCFHHELEKESTEMNQEYADFEQAALLFFCGEELALQKKLKAFQPASHLDALGYMRQLMEDLKKWHVGERINLSFPRLSEYYALTARAPSNGEAEQWQGEAESALERNIELKNILVKAFLFLERLIF